MNYQKDLLAHQQLTQGSAYEVPYKAYLDDPWNASNILNIVFLTKLKKAAVFALLKNT